MRSKIFGIAVLPLAFAVAACTSASTGGASSAAPFVSSEFALERIGADRVTGEPRWRLTAEAEHAFAEAFEIQKKTCAAGTGNSETIVNHVSDSGVEYVYEFSCLPMIEVQTADSIEVVGQSGGAPLYRGICTNGPMACVHLIVKTCPNGHEPQRVGIAAISNPYGSGRISPTNIVSYNGRQREADISTFVCK